MRAGDQAPEFSGLDQNGNLIDSKDYTGTGIVLYFYPKDLTPACTAQACSLRDHLETIRQNGYAVIGVSADTVKQHQKFAAKYGLIFPLLADPDKTIIQAYDVWGDKVVFGREMTGIIRTTFIIGANKVIERVITDVTTGTHGQQVLEK